MLSSVLVLKNNSCKEKESLLVFDFLHLEVTLLLDKNKLGSVSLDNWDQLLYAFKFFACKEEWVFYEV